MMATSTLLFALLASPAHLQTPVSDLEVLSKKEQHLEVLQRATDVKPSEREKSWRALVVKSALIISADDLQRDPLAAYQKEVDRTRAFPHLLDDNAYRVHYEKMVHKTTQACFDRVAHLQRAKMKREESGAAYADFAMCARRGERLHSDKRTHWKTLQALATTLWRGGDKEGATIALEHALRRQQKSQRQPICESEQTEYVVDAAFRRAHDTKHATAGRAIAFEFCEAVFRPEIIQQIARDPRQEVYDNACPALLRNPKAGKLLKKRCQRAQAGGSR